MHVILIEDNRGDIALFEEALIINNIEARLSIFEDGELAWNSFNNFSEFVSINGKPDLIIIDINLPKVSGKEILQLIQKQEDMSDIPRIILSTSNLMVDIEFCYKHGANCFLDKPNDVFEYFNLVKSIFKFWA